LHTFPFDLNHICIMQHKGKSLSEVTAWDSNFMSLAFPSRASQAEGWGYTDGE